MVGKVRAAGLIADGEIQWHRLPVLPHRAGFGGSPDAASRAAIKFSIVPVVEWRVNEKAGDVPINSQIPYERWKDGRVGKNAVGASMIVVGIAGGIASGKSLVAEHLTKLGAVVLDADRAGHAVLCDPDVKAQLRARWGDVVFDGSGEVDRRRVAAIVFAAAPDGPRELAWLESVSHPRIRRRLREQMRRLAESGKEVAVLDAAVMFKAGWDGLCDYLIFVDTPLEQRIARAKLRGWSEAELRSREDSQLPMAEKQRRADFVINNSATVDATLAQVENLWNSLDHKR